MSTRPGRDAFCGGRYLNGKGRPTMEPTLDVAATSEIRRQLAAAKAALTQLEALLAPMPDEDTPAAEARHHRGEG